MPNLPTTNNIGHTLYIGRKNKSRVIFQDCTHKFCRPCLKDYVVKLVQKSVTFKCPLTDCTKVIHHNVLNLQELSVRDIKDLLPQEKPTTVSQGKTKAKPHYLDPKKASGAATERLLAELKHIGKADPEKNVFHHSKSIEDFRDIV
jgi:hypothetical protein